MVEDDLPDMCRTSYQVLCVPSNMDTTELARHIANVDRGSKQDSRIFGPSHNHGKLLSDIEQVEPFMFRLNTPVFMPLDPCNWICSE